MELRSLGTPLWRVDILQVQKFVEVPAGNNTEQEHEFRASLARQRFQVCCRGNAEGSLFLVRHSAKALGDANQVLKAYLCDKVD